MKGFSYMKYTRTRVKYDKNDKPKIVPCNTPDRWIKRLRLRLQQRKIEFTEQPQGDGVFFSW